MIYGDKIPSRSRYKRLQTCFPSTIRQENSSQSTSGGTVYEQRKQKANAINNQLQRDRIGVHDGTDRGRGVVLRHLQSR